MHISAYLQQSVALAFEQTYNFYEERFAFC